MPDQSTRVLTVSLEAQGIARPAPPEMAPRYEPKDVDEARRLSRNNPTVARSKPGRGNDRDIRAWIMDYKRRTPCADCGESDPVTLDFHHRDPKTKAFTISAFRGRELAEVKAEVQKCDVLCANCHRKRHNAEGRRF